jgi:hypothetical protein
VFSKPSYITIGTKERPEEYAKKPQTRSVEKGKQVRKTSLLIALPYMSVSACFMPSLVVALPLN